MPDDFTPFTVNDALVYLYTVDAGDLPVSSVYLGGCAEQVVMNLTLTPRRLEYHGMRYASEHHDDEEHAIDLKNVWLHDKSMAVPRMPGGRGRNVRYALVIVWQDREYDAWTKRTYYGATSHGQTIDDSTYQTLKFHAEYLVESCGLLSTGDPSDLPGVTGAVRYIDDAGIVDLYNYDADTASFTAIDESLLAGRAEIQFASGSAEILFEGVPALYAVPSHTNVTEIVAVGATILDQVPRLEFWLLQNRVASLGADGTLAVVNFREGANPNTADFEFRDADGEWLFSLNTPQCTFPEIREVAEV